MNDVLKYLTTNRQRLSLERIAASSRLSCIVATPRFRASSHVVYFVFVDGVCDPVFVVKIPRLAGDEERLQTEAENLGRLHAARFAGLDAIPRLIACENFLNNPLLVQTALAGQPISSHLRGPQRDARIEAVIAWLIELHVATACRSGYVKGWYQRQVVDPLHQFLQVMPCSADELDLVEQTLQLTAVIRDQDIPLVYEHGDFGPPNILVRKDGGLGIVDWELAKPLGLPAIDLVFFLTLLGFARCDARKPAEYLAAFRKTFFEPATWARPYLRLYVDRLQLAPEILAPLLVLCWARYVAEIVWRLCDIHQPTKPLASETIHWLRSNRYYGLWHYTIKHLHEFDVDL